MGAPSILPDMRQVFGCGLMGFALCVFQGCVGGQTGDDGDAGETDTCVMVPHDIALDDVTPLGFTAREVLALAEGTDKAPLYPLENVPSATGESEFVPSEITVEVSYDGGAVQLHESTTPGTGLCTSDSQLTIEVTVHVQASDGSVDETFPATLAGTPQFAWALSSSKKVGWIVFSKLGSAGQIAGDDPALGAAQPVAQWPAQSPDCGYGWEVPNDEGSPSVLDVLDLLGRASALNIDRNREPVPLGGEPEAERVVEPLQMRVSSSVTNICATPNPSAGKFEIGFDAVLSLTGENLSFEHSLRFSAGATSLPDIPWAVRVIHSCDSAGVDFADTCGDSFDVDVEPFDRVYDDLEMNIWASPEKPVLDGTLMLSGETDDCELAQVTDTSLCGDNFEVILQRGKLSLR